MATNDPGIHIGITPLSKAHHILEGILDARVRHTFEAKSKNMLRDLGKRTDDGMLLDKCMAGKKEELQRVLQEWNNTFRKHDFRMNLEKTEVVCRG